MGVRVISKPKCSSLHSRSSIVIKSTTARKFRSKGIKEINEQINKQTNKVAKDSIVSIDKIINEYEKKIIQNSKEMENLVPRTITISKNSKNAK